MKMVIKQRGERDAGKREMRTRGSEKEGRYITWLPFYLWSQFILNLRTKRQHFWQSWRYYIALTLQYSLSSYSLSKFLVCVSVIRGTWRPSIAVSWYKVCSVTHRGSRSSCHRHGAVRVRVILSASKATGSYRQMSLGLSPYQEHYHVQLEPHSTSVMSYLTFTQVLTL